MKAADIRAVIAASRPPVSYGRLVEGGEHLSVTGCNPLQRHEADDGSNRRADGIVVDSIVEADE